MQKQLLDWFAQNQRPLPWRKHYKPYDVWVSEIMLQQTQMDTALPYYARWMKRFPDIATLAKADEKTVLKHWEGLGYYSRARNIHKSAQYLMEKHDGRFPESFDEILSIKGVGRYTAGAIASIAFNQEKPIVDGNVLRVLSRVFAISDPIDVIKNREKFWPLQEKLIPKGQARHFNQALMELGALVCTKQNPLCHQCPIKRSCKAFEKNMAEAYPVKAHKKKMVKVSATALVLTCDGRYFIRLRPVGKIMGGLWEFPEWKLPKNKALQAAEKEFGHTFKKISRIGIIKRNYTHHLETLEVFSVIVDQKLPDNSNWKSIWTSKSDFSKYPFSSAHSKIASLVDSAYKGLINY